MIEQEIIMLIMNCKKYATKALFQKATWLKMIHSNIQYYHVIGDETLETSYRFDNADNILWVKVPDDYNSLPKKVIASYSAIYETFNFKYLFKTDDDQILVNNAFLNTLTTLLQTNKVKIHYGGYIVDVAKPYLSQYHKIHPELPAFLPILQSKYCSGRFYFLSNNAIANLLLKRDKIEKEFLEDYAIGFYLDKCFKQNILSLATNKFFTDIELSDYSKQMHSLHS